MKKVLLALTLLSFSYASYSSHLLGGVLYATCNDDPNTTDYEHDVQLTLLRDYSGASAPNPIIVEIQSASQPVFYDTLQMTSTTFYTGPRPYEIITYQGQTSLAPGDYYTLSWSLCCRPPQILNINGGTSSGTGYYVEAQVSTMNGCNGTPTFVAPFALTWPKGTPWARAYSAFDMEGDSLTYQLDTCLNDNGTAVPNYVYPFTVAGGGAMLDLYSGTYAMTADSVGSYNIRVTTESFDSSGNKTGSISGDFYIEVIDANVANLITLNPPSTVVNGSYTAQIGAPDTLKFSVTTDATQMTGEYFVPSIIDTSNVYFNTSFYKQGNNFDLDFSYDPDPSEAGLEFPVVIRFDGGDWSYDYTFLVKVGSNSVSMEELSAAQFIVYPNPAKDRMTLEFEEPMTTFELVNGTGQVVHQQDISSSARSIDFEFSQTPGMYILRMTSSQGAVSHQVIIIQ